MRLLKSPPGIRIVPSAVLDARTRAQQIVDDARTQARSVVESARREADAIRDQARNAGEERGRIEANALIARAAVACAARTERDTAAIANLAVDVARTVLGREAASGPEVLRDVARRALTRMRRARKIVLRVHPDDVCAARASCREWLPAGLEPDVIDAEPDPTVAPGGVVIESEIGLLDARLDAQLEALRRAMVEP